MVPGVLDRLPEMFPHILAFYDPVSVRGRPRREGRLEARRGVVPRPAEVARVQRHRVGEPVAGFVVFPPSARGTEPALPYAPVFERALVPLSPPRIEFCAFDVQRGVPRLVYGVLDLIP